MKMVPTGRVELPNRIKLSVSVAYGHTNSKYRRRQSLSTFLGSRARLFVARARVVVVGIRHTMIDRE